MTQADTSMNATLAKADENERIEGQELEVLAESKRKVISYSSKNNI